MRAEGTHNEDEIKRLLQKAERGELSHDFEREAAEGFRAAGEVESRRAMQSLDSRAESLFRHDKNNAFVYWGMAAALVLIVGLTVFFLRGSDALEPSKQLGQASHSETDARLGPPPPVEPAAEETVAKNKKNSKTKQAEHRTSRSVAPQKEEKQLPVTAHAEEDAMTLAEPPAAVAAASGSMERFQSGESSATVMTETKDDRSAGPEEKPERRPARYKKSAAPAAGVPAQPSAQGAEATIPSEAPGPQSLADCLQHQLRERLPAWFSKEFTATVSVANDKIMSVDFPRQSGLSDREKAAADSVLVILNPKCPGVPSAETDVKISYRR